MKRATWLMAAGLGIYAMVPAACTVDATVDGTGGSTSASTSSASVAAVTTTTGPTATASSTGTGMVMTDAACDAPGTSPSNGSCYAIPKPDCSDLNGAGGAGGAGAGGSGAGATCKGAFAMADDCTNCLVDSCCDEVAACKGVPNCIECFTGELQDQKKCSDAAVVAAANKLGHCGECTTCGDLCFAKQCNPVTNEPCDTAAGEACDFSQNGFICYPAPNDQKLCEECDGSMGPFCGGGMTCLQDGGCAKFCCDDKDCGTGKCTLIQGEKVGFCVKN